MEECTSIDLDEVMTPAAKDAELGIYDNPYDEATEPQRYNLYLLAYKSRQRSVIRAKMAEVKLND